MASSASVSIDAQYVQYFADRGINVRDFIRRVMKHYTRRYADHLLVNIEIELLNEQLKKCELTKEEIHVADKIYKNARVKELLENYAEIKDEAEDIFLYQRYLKLFSKAIVDANYDVEKAIYDNTRLILNIRYYDKNFNAYAFAEKCIDVRIIDSKSLEIIDKMDKIYMRGCGSKR